LVCDEFVKRDKRLRTAKELITPSRGRGAQETKKSATSIVLFPHLFGEWSRCSDNISVYMAISSGYQTCVCPVLKLHESIV
jgi:hypothetical protein